MRIKRKSKVLEDLNKMLNVFEAYLWIAEGYTHWRSRPWSIAKLSGKGVILDLGSGACQNGVYAYKFGGEYLLCIDISFTMSFLSRKLLIKEKVLGDSIAGDMLFIPLRDNAVDNVIAIASIHHIPRRLIDLVFREVKRISSNGGTVIITVWSWRQPRFVIQTIKNIVLKLLGLKDDFREYRVPWRRRGRTIHRYYRLYTLSEILNLCKKYGLRVISYGYTGYLKNRSENIYVIAKNVKQG